MKFSKRQQVSLAILAIVLAALFIDRFFIGQGSVPVEASASSNQAPDELVPGALDFPDLDSQPPTIKLAHRLETLQPDKSMDMGQVRNAFSLPSSWLAEINPANRLLSKQDAATQFLKNHQLRAVVVHEKRCSVMVDDNYLVVGQEFDGFKLVSVDEGSATFEAGGKRVVLRLANDR